MDLNKTFADKDLKTSGSSTGKSSREQNSPLSRTVSNIADDLAMGMTQMSEKEILASNNGSSESKVLSQINSLTRIKSINTEDQQTRPCPFSISYEATKTERRQLKKTKALKMKEIEEKEASDTCSQKSKDSGSTSRSTKEPDHNTVQTQSKPGLARQLPLRESLKHANRIRTPLNLDKSLAEIKQELDKDKSFKTKRHGFVHCESSRDRLTDKNNFDISNLPPGGKLHKLALTRTISRSLTQLNEIAPPCIELPESNLPQIKVMTRMCTTKTVINKNISNEEAESESDNSDENEENTCKTQQINNNLPDLDWVDKKSSPIKLIDNETEVAKISIRRRKSKNKKDRPKSLRNRSTAKIRPKAVANDDSELNFPSNVLSNRHSVYGVENLEIEEIERQQRELEIKKEILKRKIAEHQNRAAVQTISTSSTQVSGGKNDDRKRSLQKQDSNCVVM